MPKTQGAVALAEHIQRLGMSSSAWCAMVGLDRVRVQRVLAGTRGDRMTVAFASEIQRATDGAVPVEAWAEAPTDPDHPVTGAA